jgi:hypothetical protein
MYGKERQISAQKRTTITAAAVKALRNIIIKFSYAYGTRRKRI